MRMFILNFTKSDAVFNKKIYNKPETMGNRQVNEIHF
jgi:hypothetical protein